MAHPAEAPPESIPLFRAAPCALAGVSPIPRMHVLCTKAVSEIAAGLGEVPARGHQTQFWTTFQRREGLEAPPEWPVWWSEFWGAWGP